MKEPNIAAQMDEQFRKKQVENNNQLSYVIKALRFLSRQNIALRNTSKKKVKT